MKDPLLDDVRALLDKDFGDDRILKQIFRACQNNELISNYERNYVTKLAEKHLGRKPLFLPQTVEKPAIPDVRMPLVTSLQKRPLQRKTKMSRFGSKKKKILFGIVGLVLIMIIGTAISNFDGSSRTVPPITSTSVSFSIQTDSERYGSKDLISINGASNTRGTVTLSIENQNNELVWTEKVSLKSNGEFSTISIAGGLGWEKSGTYTLKANNGNEVTSDTFSFTV